MKLTSPALEKPEIDKDIHQGSVEDRFLESIYDLDEDLERQFDTALLTDRNLTRKVVSFQANKAKPQYRWYKYKEAFSVDLVEYLIEKYKVDSGPILDPFAGAGTALFAASALGLDTDGIELLPVGQKIVEARLLTLNGNAKQSMDRMKRWLVEKPWETTERHKEFSVLRITEGAYPKETEQSIQKYLSCLESEKSEDASILLFALLCVLESISYTRKDGQYLRWDYRSGRKGFGKKIFNKGVIEPFTKAICAKIEEILSDIQGEGKNLSLFHSNGKARTQGKVALLNGSCLDVMPTLSSDHYSAIVTSPPYCNRYDYTRTYALEHAILGVSEEDNLRLRQTMISCTVENREKEILSINPSWDKPVEICNSLPLLSEILSYLDSMKKSKSLNNNGIPRMVRGYFYELACVIQECFRVLGEGGYMFMVNDNVRYAGASISVDLILSKIAEEVGFKVENILSLPQMKGNSSQQMGMHGRDALRKCVYVWRK